MPAIAVGEIVRILVNREPRLARRPLGINHVMILKLEVKEFEFIVFLRINGDS